jgi:hypothetical protein
MSRSTRLPLVETLVSWLTPQIMVLLGKVMNPMTQKTERDLPSARALIDLLAELEEKTEGRLEEGEKRLLQKTLTELRLNYLDEVSKPEPRKDEAAAPAAAAPSAEPDTAEAELAPDDVESDAPDPESRSSERPVEG